MLDPRLTHEALRTRIAKIRAAAHDQDQVRVNWELARLIDALREHLSVEAPMLEGLPEPDARVVRAGQMRIVATLSALVSDEAETDGDHAEALATELDALVELQEVVERRQFRSGHGQRM